MTHTGRIARSRARLTAVTSVPLMLACSACSDAIWDFQAWWAPAFGPLFLGFCAEGVACTFLRRRARTHRRVEAALAFLALVVLIVVGGGVLLGLAVACAVLLFGLARSMIVDSSFPPTVTAARIGVIMLGLSAGLWRAWPSHRTTGELLEGAAYVSRFPLGDGWMIDELRSRPDALKALAFDLTHGNETHVILHARLGGPPADRADACARLKLSPCP